MNWRDRVYHVVPVDDLVEHVTSGKNWLADGRSMCSCNPDIQVERREDGRRFGVLVVHNAADGRDLVERHGVN